MAWLDAAPSWLGLAATVGALLAARADWSGAGSAGLAVLASLLALALVQALWTRPRRRSDAVPAVAPVDAAQPPAATLMRGEHVLLVPGLDIAEVLDMARSRFLRLQAAWDAGDVAALTSLTTPDMLDELLQVLDARLSATPCRTDVVSLHAELLGLEEMGAAWLASVEFSGLIRESAEAGAVPFRELWMLSATKDGTPSWRLARQQALL